MSNAVIEAQAVREVVGEEPYTYIPLGRYVVRAEGECSGRPTLKYTRIEVAGTLARLAAGEPLDAIVAGYRGYVPREAIQEAAHLARLARTDS